MKTENLTFVTEVIMNEQRPSLVRMDLTQFDYPLTIRRLLKNK